MKFQNIAIGLSSLIFSGMTLAAEIPSKPDEMGSTLKLTKEQREQLIKLHASAEECFNNIDAGGYQPKLFLDMVKKGKVDEKEFNQQLDLQNKLHDQAAHCKITYYTNVSNMLSAEQKQKLVEMYKKGMQ
ncbi:hypothetical protein ABLU83_21695 [Klebsiella sp. CN_Kp098]|uniref:Spy/CpxP family protein refolding chaperone n=1 Tax=unclassified Klebsiella TaxID=2608929 RepID=UPI0032B378D9